PVMQPSRNVGITNGFSDRHRKGNYVMLHLGFELIDPRNIHLGPCAERSSRLRRHLPSFGKRFRRGQLHIKPSPVTVFVAPDLAHLYSRVAWNHLGFSMSHTPK